MSKNTREDAEKPKMSGILGMVGVGSGWMQIGQSLVS